jgi:methylated-DNA-[protein]-cysteine S-methyltransferase
MNLYLDRIDSGLGEILVVSNGKELCAVEFSDHEPRMRTLLQQRYPDYQLQDKPNDQGFSDRLQAYFQGNLTALDSIPIDPRGTSFQQQVWAELRAIPPGKTWSYGELAQRIGKPTASRAVGMANSLNSIAIVIPCHRVIGSNGSLTGYAGGVDRKRWLLNHESGITAGQPRV